MQKALSFYGVSSNLYTKALSDIGNVKNKLSYRASDCLTQRHFLLLLPVLVTVFLTGATASGESDAEIHVAVLDTPELDADVSGFAETGNIGLSVVFAGPDGIGWIVKNATGTTDEDVYESHRDGRMFVVEIDNVENSQRMQLEADDISFATDDDFVELHGRARGYDRNQYVVEVLDIDELVSPGNHNLDMHLAVSSAKLFPGYEYELRVWTNASHSPEKTSFVIPRDAGVSDDDSSESTEKITCPVDYDPVCGIDGITYSNQCYLGAVELDYEGKCKDVTVLEWSP